MIYSTGIVRYRAGAKRRRPRAKRRLSTLLRPFGWNRWSADVGVLSWVDERSAAGNDERSMRRPIAGHVAGEPEPRGSANERDLTVMQEISYTSRMPRLPSIVRPPALAEVNVARRIAVLRRENKLTLRELSEHTGLSEAYLNRVERQKTPINIANLEKVANAFTVPLGSFFETDTARQPLIITRAGTGKKVRFRGRGGFRVELLADPKKGKLMEPLLVDLSSAREEVPLQSHPGQEFNYVVDGRCLFLFGKDRIELRIGDAVYFDASVPHVCRAVGRSVSRILAVVASSDYPLHGNIAVLLNR